MSTESGSAWWSTAEQKANTHQTPRRKGVREGWMFNGWLKLSGEWSRPKQSWNNTACPSLMWRVVALSCVAAIEGQGDIQCNGKAAVQNQSKGIQMKSWCNECTDNTTTETCRGLNSIKKHSWIFEIRQQLKLPQESDYSVSCRNWFLITWNQDASYKETPMEGRQPHGNLNPGPSHQPESFGTAVRLRTLSLADLMCGSTPVANL